MSPGVSSLVARGRSLPLPRPVRAVLRALALVAVRRGAAARLDGWERPLVPGRSRPAAVGPGAPQPSADVARPGSGSGPVPGPGPASGSGAGAPLCLVVVPALDAGGMDEVAAFLVRNLPARGLRTAALVVSATAAPDGRPTGRLGGRLSAEGHDVRECGPDQVSDVLAALRPDVLSLHGAPGQVLRAASAARLPCVETLHGMHDLYTVDPAVEAVRAAQVSRFVAVSELVRQQYLAVNPLYPADRVLTVPNGVDRSARPAADRAVARAGLGLDAEFLVVSLGRHCLQKNTYGLVRNFLRVAEKLPTAHLLVAGRPDDELYVAETLALRSRSRFADRIHLRDNHPDPASLLAAADLFVLDSFFEGWSMASMEALLAGTPVVLTEVGGAVDQVGDDPRRGTVVPNPVGDPLAVTWETILEVRFGAQQNDDALVAAVVDAARRGAPEPAERRRIAAEAAERFDLERCLDGHTEILSTALRAAAADQPR